MLVLLRRWGQPLVLMAYGMFVSAALLLGDERQVSQFFWEDDGYFFMTIARNLARGLGPTFDKIHETNGFHPLWLIVLTAFFKAVLPLADDPLVLRRLVGALSLLIALFAWQWHLNWLRSMGVSHGERLIAITLLVSMLGFRFYGLETYLLALMLAFHMAAAWAVWEAPSPKRSFRFGLTAALLILTRLDTALIVGLLSLGVIAQSARNRSAIAALSTMLPAAAPLAILLGAYFAFNYLRFGHALPITALVLLREPMTDFVGLQSLSDADRLAYPIIVMFSALAIGGALHRGYVRAVSGAAADRVGFGGLLGASALAMLVFQVVFQRTVNGWHLAAPLTVAITAGTLSLSSSAAGARWPVPLRAAAMAVALAIAAQGIVSAERVGDDHLVFLKEASTRLRDGGPAFRVDGSGALGWFCDCRLINGDGVVNNADFARGFLGPRRIREYLDREGVRWVIVDSGIGPVDGRVWLEAWDWETHTSYRALGFPVEDAVVHVGAEWLFPYPGSDPRSITVTAPPR